MALTNFPNGISSFGVPVLPAAQTPRTGDVFFVDSGAAFAGDISGYGTFEHPFSTIDFAIGKCSASNGDTIYVLPGHAEALSSATALVADVAGVSIIGVGSGSDRPTLTLDTADTATIAVSAANVTFRNLIITANFADITAAFTLTAAANLHLEQIEFKATATNMNFVNCVSTSAVANAADGLQVVDCSWIDPDAGASRPCLLLLNEDLDKLLLSGSFVHLGGNNNVPALVDIANGMIITNAQILANRVIRLNTDTSTDAILLHTDGSTLTGIVAGNFAQHADTAAELLITASCGLSVFENYASGVAGLSGYVLPARDA